MRGYTYINYIREEKTNLPDNSIPGKCKDRDFMVERHCMIAHLLQYYDYIISIDADSGVINPNHCFEEYMAPDHDLVFMERVHSGEVTASQFTVKNTTFAKEFLMKVFEYCKSNLTKNPP